MPALAGKATIATYSWVNAETRGWQAKLMRAILSAPVIKLPLRTFTFTFTGQAVLVSVTLVSSQTVSLIVRDREQNRDS